MVLALSPRNPGAPDYPRRYLVRSILGNGGGSEGSGMWGRVPAKDKGGGYRPGFGGGLFFFLVLESST